MFKNLFILLILTSHFLVSEDHYIIVSYPRTANTWVRYSVEYLLKCPTIGPGGGFYEGTIPYEDHEALLTSADRDFNLPIDSCLHLGVKKDNPYFLKLHKIDSIENLEGPMILILRNYKECIPSQLLRDRIQATYDDLVRGIENREHYYFTNIETFDAYQGRKLLIYYEDLMENTKTALKEILDFTHLEYEDLDQFVADLPKHKERVIEFYRKIGHFDSVTRGDDQAHFQKNLTPNERKNLDQFIIKRYPNISQKYLSRYFEKEDIAASHQSCSE